MQLVDQASAVIHFTPKGKLLHAKANFLAGTGNSEGELEGKHHRIFVDPAFGASQAYKDFWRDLSQGKVFASRISRYQKSGAEIWLQATYGPVKDAAGRVISVVKVATAMTDVQDNAAGLIMRCLPWNGVT